MHLHCAYRTRAPHHPTPSNPQEKAKEEMLKQMGAAQDAGDGSQMSTEQFERSKPAELKKDIRMISGCQDKQTSADVSNVLNFQLPDPAGRAGGACTSTLLKILYADERVPEDDLRCA